MDTLLILGGFALSVAIFVVATDRSVTWEFFRPNKSDVIIFFWAVAKLCLFAELLIRIHVIAIRISFARDEDLKDVLQTLNDLVFFPEHFKGMLVETENNTRQLR